MGIPIVNVGINKLFLSIPIQGRYIGYFLSLMISSLKCLLHFQDINLESRTHDMHGDHSTKGDIHSYFPFQQHFVHVKDHNQIDFLLLKNLDNLVKGKVIHGLGCL